MHKQKNYINFADYSAYFVAESVWELSDLYNNASAPRSGEINVDDQQGCLTVRLLLVVSLHLDEREREIERERERERERESKRERDSYRHIITHTNRDLGLMFHIHFCILRHGVSQRGAVSLTLGISHGRGDKKISMLWARQN